MVVCYLLASAIILGRASGGDWTSAGDTVVEFMVGWPALLLTMFAVVVERLYILRAKAENNANSVAVSILWGVLFIAIAVMSVMLLPQMSENPIYRDTIIP